MEGFFILVLVVAVGFVIVKAIRSYQASVNEAWKSAASMLGLRFFPGSLLQSRKLEGELQGARVEVDTFTKSQDKSSTTYTRYRAFYPEALDLNLRLEPQEFFSGLKTFFGGQDIQVGDKAFDDAIVVKGAAPARVVEFLTPSRRLRILRLFSAPGDSLVESHRVTRSRKGTARDANEIAGTTERLAQFAIQLAGSSTPTMDEALEAQRAGRLDEALELVGATPESEKDTDARLVEGQILATAGRQEEAEVVLRRAHEASPGDEELRAWAQQGESAPSPEVERAALAEAQPITEPRPVAEPSSVESTPDDPIEPRPADPEPPVAAQNTGSDTPEAAAVCEALFAAGIMSLETNRLFKERFKGRDVQWTGTIREVRSYYIDFVFGSDPGTRLVMDLHDVSTGPFGSMVQAIVQLPPEAVDDFAARIDEKLTVEGTLVGCDALVRNLYVANARVI